MADICIGGSPVSGMTTKKFDDTGIALWSAADTGTIYGLAYSGDYLYVASGAKLTQRNIDTGLELWQIDLTVNHDDRVQSVWTDALGNVYIHLYYYWHSGMLSEYRFYINKYDSSGSLIWSKLRDTYSAGLFSGLLAVDSQGNVYINGEPQYATHYFEKYDTDGNLIWSKASLNPSEFRIGLDDYLYITNIYDVISKIDSDGNVVLQIDGSLIAGIFFYYPKADIDGNIFVDRQFDFNDSIIKYDSSGSLLWEVTLPTGFIVYSLDVSSSDVCVAGDYGTPDIYVYDSKGLLSYSASHGDTVNVIIFVSEATIDQAFIG
jgi:hypothetical protein